MNNFLYIPAPRRAEAKARGLHFSSTQPVLRFFYYSRAIFTHWIQFGFTYSGYDLRPRSPSSQMGIYSHYLGRKKQKRRKKNEEESSTWIKEVFKDAVLPTQKFEFTIRYRVFNINDSSTLSSFHPPICIIYNAVCARAFEIGKLWEQIALRKKMMLNKQPARALKSANVNSVLLRARVIIRTRTLLISLRARGCRSALG